eukprot:COSAG02_NODE_697_length_18379_cov_37.948687_3_plen_69_part_00
MNSHFQSERTRLTNVNIPELATAGVGQHQQGQGSGEAKTEPAEWDEISARILGLDVVREDMVQIVQQI